ncbi:hypothetical protein, partial [Paenibacillus marchantiophytorum]|uniref:hypothetical protein n=1 Tax=Paenibacillus marchantiophytorum TaxID=1619310 RepID=UPI001E45C500
PIYLKAEMLIDLLARFYNLFFERLLVRAYSLVVQFSKINFFRYFIAIRLAATFSIYHSVYLQCKFYFREL